MTLRVLGAGEEGCRQWQRVLERLPVALRDLHYLPEYGLVYHDAYRYEPMLAVFEANGGQVLYAFVRRSLHDLPFLADVPVSRAFADIATPYGFGGPLVCADRDDVASGCLRGFDEAFRHWAAGQGFASEFVCLHPLLANHLPIAASGIASPQLAKTVVVIDLQRSEDALWHSVSRGTRSSIQRAMRSGVRVDPVPADESALEIFQTLYTRTMQRRSAEPRWFFPPSYFPACMRRLGTRRSTLFFARCEGEVVAAFLLLHEGATAYYHFGASDERWLERRPNNLLMYETMRWAKQQGFTRYHLGGGVSAAENDGLLRFKSSFGGHRAALYTYHRVLNESVYRELCELKRRHESSASQRITDVDYFPLYRRS